MASLAAKVRGDLPLLALDAVLVSMGYLVMLVLRFDGAVPADYWRALQIFLPIAAAVHLAVYAAAGLYGQVWRHASVIEAQRIVGASLAVGAMFTSAYAVVRPFLPLSVVVGGALLAPLLIGGLRFQARLFAFNRRKREAFGRPGGLRIVVVGAGDAAGQLIREMVHNPHLGLIPVAIVDDETRLQRRSIAMVRVEGRINDLPTVIARHEAHEAVLAISNADGALVRRVAGLADQASVTLKVVPGTRERVSGEISLRDVRDLEIADLLGREQVTTDLDAVRATLQGKRVLITGAGGSIGSEIAKQVHAFEPASLVLLDRDETLLFEVAAKLKGGAVTQALCDIRDSRSLERLFAQHEPEVVFHAAALKHVPLLEAHVLEAVATNVRGTANVVAACRRRKVERFVLVSTDKAVNPVSVMGATKRLGELTVLASQPQGAQWCAVRFGNVLGSRGSVIPLFMLQIAAGGPVTVTDPRMTRYFMSIPEAVQLVLQAGALADGGEVFMLDMGEPIRILDLAERMIRLSGRRVGEDIAIEVTGKRPGEKLEERLTSDFEGTSPTEHPSIRQVSTTRPPPDMDRGMETLVRALAEADPRRATQVLWALVGASTLQQEAADLPELVDEAI